MSFMRAYFQNNGYQIWEAARIFLWIGVFILFCASVLYIQEWKIKPFSSKTSYEPFIRTVEMQGFKDFDI